MSHAPTHSATKLPSPTALGWGGLRHMTGGWIALAVLVFGTVIWGAIAQISGAVVASGSLEVQGNRQVVQHLTGGIVETIGARNGDHVKAGDTLIELNGDTIKAQFGTVDGQWMELLAQRSRLIAERDSLDAIAFLPEIEARKSEPAIAALIQAQQRQFDASRKVHLDESELLDKQHAQVEEQIRGYGALLASTERQIEVVKGDVARQKTLFDQKLTEADKLSTLQREQARLEGNAGQIAASVSEQKAKLLEIEIEKVRLTSTRQKEAIEQLRETEFREIELRENHAALAEQIRNLRLTAPADGVVYGSKVETLHSVVTPAEPLLYIVPENAPLIVKAKIQVQDVDQIYPGQQAVLRFSAFNSRTTPEGHATVTLRSADAIEDPQTRARYYEVDLTIDPETREKIAGLELVPGMPVEAFIETHKRSALSYFTKPFTDYFSRAFRQE